MKETVRFISSGYWAAVRSAALVGFVVALIAAVAVGIGCALVLVPRPDNIVLIGLLAAGVGFLAGVTLSLGAYFRTGMPTGSLSRAIKDLWHAFGRTDF